VTEGPESAKRLGLGLILFLPAKPVLVPAARPRHQPVHTQPLWLPTACSTRASSRSQGGPVAMGDAADASGSGTLPALERDESDDDGWLGELLGRTLPASSMPSMRRAAVLDDDEHSSWLEELLGWRLAKKSTEEIKVGSSIPVTTHSSSSSMPTACTSARTFADRQPWNRGFTPKELSIALDAKRRRTAARAAIRSAIWAPRPAISPPIASPETIPQFKSSLMLVNTFPSVVVLPRPAQDEILQTFLASHSERRNSKTAASIICKVGCLPLPRNYSG